MKNLLTIENLALFILSIFIFGQTPFDWWWYPTLFLLPDIGMVGYAINPRTGAIVYNIFHHLGTAVLFIVSGWYFQANFLLLGGSVFLGHTALDRIFGYGLKYSDSFHRTHLGYIGKEKGTKSHP